MATDRPVGLDMEVVELALLLRRESALCLERLACSRGHSLGKLIRQVLDDYLARQSGSVGGDPAGAAPRPGMVATPGNSQ